MSRFYFNILSYVVEFERGRAYLVWVGLFFSFFFWFRRWKGGDWFSFFVSFLSCLDLYWEVGSGWMMQFFFRLNVVGWMFLLLKMCRGIDVSERKSYLGICFIYIYSTKLSYLPIGQRVFFLLSRVSMVVVEVSCRSSSCVLDIHPHPHPHPPAGGLMS